MTALLPQQASNDEHMIALWLFGRSPRTQTAYRADVGRFLTLIQKPLHAVTMGDLHTYAVSLAHLSPATQARRMASLKSLLSKAHKLGYIVFNPGPRWKWVRSRIQSASAC